MAKDSKKVAEVTRVYEMGGQVKPWCGCVGCFGKGPAVAARFAMDTILSDGRRKVFFLCGRHAEVTAQKNGLTLERFRP